jgi:hypothetical protein
MSTEGGKLDVLLKQAAGIVTASQNKVGITKAMELVGCSVKVRKTMRYYQKVRRLAVKLSIVKTTKKTAPTEEVNVSSSASQVSTLSLAGAESC